MDKLDVVIWVLSSGFTLMFVLMATMWHSLGSRFDRVDQRIDKLDEKVTDIDRRLCRLEGAFSSKDCCMIKEDKPVKKVE